MGLGDFLKQHIRQKSFPERTLSEQGNQDQSWSDLCQILSESSLKDFLYFHNVTAHPNLPL